MKTLVVVPARMGSSRFPGKPLADLCGKPMVQWVVEASRASGADEVVVATPDDEIAQACAAFGARAVMTSHEHQTGTDRVAEVAASLEAEVYVNVQGDEPLVEPGTVAACANAVLLDRSVPVASVYCDCPESEWDDPAVVKVVTDRCSDALYFSRWPLPYARNPRTEPVKKHLGVYAFRRSALAAFQGWPASSAEKAESLEQLRFLDNGVKIRMAKGLPSALAVDTPEQAEVVRAILAQRGEQDGVPAARLLE